MTSLIGLLCCAGLAVPAQAKLVSREARLEAVRRARIHAPVEVETMDLRNGPAEDGYALGQELRCVFEERDPSRPIGGHAKKFPCRDASGRRLKVKYDPQANREVFGEVAGSRLFWALGFFAERLYSVKLVCENCPKDPFVSDAPPRARRIFEPATLQNKLEGAELSETEGEGWTFDELALIDEERGAATRAQADALKLLAAFVNHGDNTPNQQRLLCAKDDPHCERPMLVVTDLGGTFGGRDYLTSYKNWAKKEALWKDPERCQLDFQGTWSRYKNPVVGEPGRRLLAELLGRLSEKQVRDLFTGARFDLLTPFETPVPMPDGKVRRPTIDDWTRLFLKKREQILSARCPP